MSKKTLACSNFQQYTYISNLSFRILTPVCSCHMNIQKRHILIKRIFFYTIFYTIFIKGYLDFCTCFYILLFLFTIYFFIRSLNLLCITWFKKCQSLVHINRFHWIFLSGFLWSNYSCCIYIRIISTLQRGIPPIKKSWNSRNLFAKQNLIIFTTHSIVFCTRRLLHQEGKDNTHTRLF